MTDPFEHYSPLERYVANLYAAEDDTLRWVREEADRQEMPRISVQPYEGRLLYMLALSVGARRAVEIGTLAGYSGIWLARALPADGQLITLEKSEKHAWIARASFERVGLSERVEVRQGDAHDLLKHISGPVDFVFIDADKASYPAYLAWAVEHLRPGGMVAAHNAFRAGKVINPETEDDRIMDAFNRSLAEHPQLEAFVIGVGDGMAIAVKRPA